MNREGAEVEKMSDLIYRAGPAGILRSKLTLALKHWKQREREERLTTLLGAETVCPFRRSPPRGRIAIVYVHRDHLTSHKTQFPGDEADE